MIEDRYSGAERFVSHIESRVISDAQGSNVEELSVRPADRIWLGRLGPEEAAWRQALGQRGQRLEPCACGIRFMPTGDDPHMINIEAEFRVWLREGQGEAIRWLKSPLISARIDVEASRGDVRRSADEELAAALAAAGLVGWQARIDLEVADSPEGLVVAVTLVNETPEKGMASDPNLYEAVVKVRSDGYRPFLLDALPDSFRYDRKVPAYGINTGVLIQDGSLVTSDAVASSRGRVSYRPSGPAGEIDLSFEALSTDPVPRLTALVDALETWGSVWGVDSLEERARRDDWSDEMLREATGEASKFQAEVERCRLGLSVLDDATALTALKLTNEAIAHSGRGKYTEWRPFQLGFFLACLPGLVSTGPDRTIVDSLWFATGGGKTETYLALTVFTCLWDRLSGKRHGVSVWSRFPLRMLSLQQTQRFADALAGAELARRRHELPGDPFALGFFVGGTPNRIRDDPDAGEIDAGDRHMPAHYRVLIACPFCRNDALGMRFDRRTWQLNHECGNDSCPWPERALPFVIVDEEIYRTLPSVVIGTLDKAASVSIQAAMRGLYAQPLGICKSGTHGFTYAPRKKTPNGCLMPDCSYDIEPLPANYPVGPPTLHIQDELHLLRDNLGAVSSHYETLFQHLRRRSGFEPIKLIASSATLAGHEDQVRTLYSRAGRTFPVPGPTEERSFWSEEGASLARRYVAIAPRGVTLEFANDRLAESLQAVVRELVENPDRVLEELGIDPSLATFLIDTYGTHVVYGSRVRDVEAAARSFETQIPFAPLNVEKLTGQTLFEEVSEVLRRLGQPEAEFGDRIHIVCASSMMSHGVDVDRFNVITMLGFPLTAAEFIQTTARIGRKWPGLVFVLPRIGGERDASIYGVFPTYVRHGNRFIEPIPITRRSRRVLEHTFAGLFSARVVGIHEPEALAAGGKALTTAPSLRRHFLAFGHSEEQEFEELADALAIDPGSVEPLAEELGSQVRALFAELLDPASKAFLLKDLTARPAMRSLREVELQIPLRIGADGGGHA